MKKIISSILAFAVISLSVITTSCEKQDAVTPTVTEGGAPEQIWPWLIAAGISAVTTIAIEYSEGQATNVTYENGALTGYSCTGWGSCHIAGMSNSTNGGSGGTGTLLNTVESLYPGDITIEDFEIVKTEEGQVLLGGEISNPATAQFFPSEEYYLSIPVVLDNADFLEEFGLEEPIEIGGYYDVIQDGNVRYIVIQ